MVLSDADLNPYSLQSFKLYETRARFYLVGCDSNRTHWRVLKIDRSEPAELNINEDPVIYTQQECTKLLQTVAEGNRATGGLTMVTKAYGIIGFIKFLESYYMILVTKRRQIGTLCGHAVYAIDENQVITVPHSSVQTDLAHSKTELRYKKLLSSVDLTKDFFFSYTYKMMQSLQKNSLAGDTEGMPFGNMFVWNAFLTKGIRERLKNTLWIVALVHGYFEQAKISIYGHVFSLTLIARRSRHFAGTRYLKRGVNDKGRVANDVETEQIILDEDSGAKPGQMSSVVQNRGSIPLFWSQEASRLSPKPDIVLQRYDPFYEATRLHFEDLSVRYGDPIIILNLIKTVEKRPREMMLRREFANAVGYLNQILSEEKHLKFIHWDFHKFAKSKSANVLAVLGGVASEALDLTGIYYTGKWSNNKAKLQNQRRLSSSSNISMNHEREPQKRSSNGESVQNRPKGMTLQNGVLRTNCIDCLDRTNVAQYAYGLAALGRQLNAVGLTDVAKVDPDSSIAAALMEMYQNMGDALALQYGGSAAHNTVFPERQGRWKATTQSREFLKSIRRYYSNAYTDCDKQDAINLFLGYFHPEEGKPALWELDSDYYLHSRGEESPYETKLSREATSSFNSNSLSRVPTYRDDFNRVKLTSFDKLLQVTCGSLKLLRVYSESEMKSGAGTTSGTAPDAAEVQLKSPNWLFGHRKHEHTELASSVISSNTHDKKEEQISNEFDFDWVSSLGILSEEDKYDRHSLTSATSEQEHWYGTELLPGLVSDSPANLHYAGLCEVKDISPFDFTSEEPPDHLVLNDENAIEVIATMQSAMDEYAKIGDDLGCRMTNVPLHANHADRISKWMFSGSTLS